MHRYRVQIHDLMNDTFLNRIVEAKNAQDAITQIRNDYLQTTRRQDIKISIRKVTYNRKR